MHPSRRSVVHAAAWAAPVVTAAPAFADSALRSLVFTEGNSWVFPDAASAPGGTGCVWSLLR